MISFFIFSYSVKRPTSCSRLNHKSILDRLRRKLWSLYNHSRILPWDQAILSNDDKVPCTKKQQLATDRVRTHTWLVINKETPSSLIEWHKSISIGLKMHIFQIFICKFYFSKVILYFIITNNINIDLYHSEGFFLKPKHKFWKAIGTRQVERIKWI